MRTSAQIGAGESSQTGVGQRRHLVFEAHAVILVDRERADEVDARHDDCMP
jgi:hypothetical protein